MCLTFLFRNLEVVAIRKSVFLIADSRFLNILVSSIIFFAPTEVAKILSLGKIGFGSTTTNYLKLKFLMALAQAPIFSDN